MEHSCQKCGAAVEDGRPFCPQCRAPQIHVDVAPAVSTEPSEAVLGETGQTISAIPGFGGLPVQSHTLLDREAAVRAALKAGVLGFFLGMLPLLGTVLTGSVAVYFYRRERGLPPAPGIGGRLGAAAGIISFGINSLVILVRVFVFHAQSEYVDAMIKIARTFGYDTSDPTVQSALQNLFTGPGLALTLFFGMVLTVALTAVGGALAVLIMRNRPRG
jgi:hypothetical protein